MKILFFILAGGYGKRAQPLSLVKPKPVFPMDGTPLLRIMLNRLNKKGVGRGFINLHHLPGSIRECVAAMPEKCLLRFLYEEELSGSRILKGALPGMGEDDLLLVVNGDIFLEIPVKEMLRQVTTGRNDVDGVLLVRYNRERDTRYKAIIARDEVFTGRKIHGDSDSASVAKSLMYTGVSLFRKNVVRAIRDINFFDSLEKNPLTIKVLIYDGIWLDIGDPSSYVESNFAYKAYVKGERGGSNSLSENVTVSPGSRVEHSIIWENTEIKNRSVIKNCVIAGNVSLDNVHIENEIIVP